MNPQFTCCPNTPKLTKVKKKQDDRQQLLNPKQKEHADKIHKDDIELLAEKCVYLIKIVEMPGGYW